MWWVRIMWSWWVATVYSDESLLWSIKSRKDFILMKNLFYAKYSTSYVYSYKHSERQWNVICVSHFEHRFESSNKLVDHVDSLTNWILYSFDKTCVAVAWESLKKSNQWWIWLNQYTEMKVQQSNNNELSEKLLSKIK